MTKAIPAALMAHYRGGFTTVCTCWHVKLTNLTEYFYTDHHSDVLFEGNLYLAAGGYTPTAVDTSSELNPDNLEVQGFISAFGITAEDFRTGRWDYAAVEIFKVNYIDPTMGKDILRSGTLGEVKGGEKEFTAELRGLMQAYTRTIVRLTAAECNADFGDARCKKDATAFTFSGTVSTVINNREWTDAGRSEATGYFTGGKVVWVTGLNTGLGMEVKVQTGTDIALHQLMPYDIVVGDTYRITAGCLHRRTEDCHDKFANVVNFRGFPDLPNHDAYQIGKGTNANSAALIDATYSDTTVTSTGGGI